MSASRVGGPRATAAGGPGVAPREAQRTQSRARPLDIGLETIARWRIDDEQHLPRDKAAAPAFLPDARPLDDILRRPSLDERLPNLLRPDTVDPDLMHPATMTAVREGLADRFRALEATARGADRAAFDAAAAVMEGDVEMDRDVRSSLAMLLRG